jgi:hypothetical protein
VKINHNLNTYRTFTTSCEKSGKEGSQVVSTHPPAEVDLACTINMPIEEQLQDGWGAVLKKDDNQPPQQVGGIWILEYKLGGEVIAICFLLHTGIGVADSAYPFIGPWLYGAQSVFFSLIS